MDDAPPRRARWWQKLLLLVATLVVLAPLAELLLTALDLCAPHPRWELKEDDRGDHQNLRPDDVLGWRFHPDRTYTLVTEGNSVEYESDALGFRVDGDAPAAPKGAKRIAFVGDSFTYGIGVAASETFAARTAAALGAVALNRGIPGYGIDQMWLTLRHVVLPGKPDLVVVAMIDDDFERTLHLNSVLIGVPFTKPVFRLDGGKLVPVGEADRPGALSRFLDRKSRVLAGWRGAWRRIGRRWPVGEWWKTNAAVIDAMIEDARAADVPILFAFIRRSNHWIPFATLEQHLAARGVAFLDIGAQWGSSPAEGYYPKDGHYNAVGHAAAGEALARAIAERWPHLVQE